MNKVFGLGLHRTGTTSLSFALNALGIKTIHFPHDERTYKQLIKGDYNLDVMKNYQGACDISISPFFKQLDRTFPDSKFILTIRDIPSWLKSTSNHWFDNNRDYKDGLSHDNKFALFIRSVNYGCLNYAKDRFTEVYEDHCEKVINYFKDRPNDLLILNICNGEGWEKLCPFLNKPIPSSPFHHLNKSKIKI